VRPIVPPQKHCRHCGAPGQRFLHRCARCGRRRWLPISGVPGARY
jgi:hypothetical protein